MTPEIKMGKTLPKKKKIEEKKMKVPIPTSLPTPPSKTCDPYTGEPDEESRTIKSFEVIGHFVCVRVCVGVRVLVCVCVCLYGDSANEGRALESK